MKVYNPNPCLINVYANGKYVAIAPGATVEVNSKAAKPLIDSGQLVNAGKEEDSEEQDTEETEDETAEETDADETEDDEVPAKKSRRRR